MPGYPVGILSLPSGRQVCGYSLGLVISFHHMQRILFRLHSEQQLQLYLLPGGCVLHWWQLGPVLRHHELCLRALLWQSSTRRRQLGALGIRRAGYQHAHVGAFLR